MKTRDISTRADGHATDMTKAAEAVTTYSFPELGVSVEATNYSDALVKAKEAYKAAKQ